MISQTSHDVLEVKPNQPPHDRADRAGVGESVNGGLEGLNEQPEVINESVEESSDESNRSTPETEAGAGMASDVGRSYQNNFYNSIVFNINM
ncbi:hypothetical protein K4K58_000622 [Colletotrichum sp. SAR11_239]|nr:hypothetical protein K4K58_000622 [Colletotrichum sp. SAR11_239]KAJ5006260.1 hypothetical protein K4K48_004417 [Colletotrichum sp. SAR 10_66]